MSTKMLTAIRGERIVSIRRVLYVHRGVVQAQAGPLELTFEGGSSVVLDAGGDGESLAVRSGIWLDPFEEPLSDENRKYVEASGKWTGFEVTAGDPLAGLIGQKLAGVTEARNPSDKVTGVVLQIGASQIYAHVDSDELFVDFV